ncbi:hypothetical protein BU16DRAFT_554759 [Lophium mytilinum]|uniref:Uncharacterized protein n=1 Tax=Lophium mytilinum TaxID=390894 RepID=A0A6A6REB1_9PEZI|nr:hypothetical protein BU16DRAFT_554759 [Lophium mytilinum]
MAGKRGMPTEIEAGLVEDSSTIRKPLKRKKSGSELDPKGNHRRARAEHPPFLGHTYEAEGDPDDNFDEGSLGDISEARHLRRDQLQTSLQQVTRSYTRSESFRAEIEEEATTVRSSGKQLVTSLKPVTRSTPTLSNGIKKTISEYLADFLEERDFTASLELGRDSRVHITLSFPSTSMSTISLLPPKESTNSQALTFLPPVVSTEVDPCKVVPSIKALTVEDGLRPFETIDAPTSLSFTTPSSRSPLGTKAPIAKRGRGRPKKTEGRKPEVLVGNALIGGEGLGHDMELSGKLIESLDETMYSYDEVASGFGSALLTYPLQATDWSGGMQTTLAMPKSISTPAAPLSTKTSRTDDELLDPWANFSVLKRYQMEPSVFSNKGRFRLPYQHLTEKSKELPQPTRIRKTQSRVLRNRDTNQMVKIDLRVVFVAAVEVHPMSATKRIIIGFTRASGEAPAYGTPGMTKRAAMAVKAFADLDGDAGVVKVAIQRTKVSSRASFFDDSRKERTDAYIVEMVAVLNAAKNGREVVLLSVGADGFTTNVDNFVWLAETWPLLELNLVVVVPSWFPGDKAVFREATNGIRYGRFSIKHVAAAVLQKDRSGAVGELLRVCEQINMGKEHLENRPTLTTMTSHRSTFRIHPDTEDDDGVGPELRKSRARH